MSGVAGPGSGAHLGVFAPVDDPHSALQAQAGAPRRVTRCRRLGRPPHAYRPGAYIIIVVLIMELYQISLECYILNDL